MKLLAEYADEYKDKLLCQSIGFSTGLERLDRITYGLQRSEFTVIAGRTSMGKTSLLLDIALSISKENGVGIFSLEMNARELIRRMLSILSGVGFQRIRSGRLLDNEKQLVDAALKELCRRKIFIDDRTGLTVRQIEQEIESIKQPVDCVIVDYIQLIRPPERYRSRVDEVTEASAGLKGIAKFFNVSLVAACQLNRSAESREVTEYRPQLSDLRESGAIENDADLVALLYRPYYYERNRNPSAVDDGRAEIIIAKSRNGPTTTIYTQFDSECMSFSRAEVNRINQELF